MKKFNYCTVQYTSLIVNAVQYVDVSITNILTSVTELEPDWC